MRELVHDTGVLAGRNLKALQAKGLIGPIVNPLIFFLGFYVVLHRILVARGVDFGAFFPPGIVVQSLGLLALGTAQFTARDRRNGLLTRYRMLPIKHDAVLAGRLLADTIPALLSTLVVIAAGLLVGFRFHAGVLPAFGFVALAVAFAVVLSAGAGAAGLAVRRSEAVASMLFVLFLPLVNFSTAFVPVQGFPGWLRPFVKVSPMTAVADALRALAAGGPTLTPLWHALAWLTGLGALFFWLASRAFRRIT
jgi:ABC-2 type transport system permease protein